MTTRGVDTRRRLMDAARVVFETSGFVDARVQDITRSAAVSHGSFYTYFESKEDIFRAVADEILERVYEATYVRDESSTSPYERIAAANRRHVEAYEEYKEFLVTLDQVASFRPEFFDRQRELRSRFVEHYAAILRKFQDQGIVDGDLDAYHAACALGAMVEHSLRWWLGRGERHDRAVAVATLDRLWSNAIGLAHDAADVSTIPTH